MKITEFNEVRYDEITIESQGAKCPETFIRYPDGWWVHRQLRTIGEPAPACQKQLEKLYQEYKNENNKV